MAALAKTRHWLSPLTTVFFVAIGFTGILMLLHLRVPGIRLLHQIAGPLFIVAGTTHLVLNWRVLCAYFRTRAARIALVAGMLLCAVLAVLDLGRGGEEEGGHRRRPEQHESRPWQ